MLTRNTMSIGAATLVLASSAVVWGQASSRPTSINEQPTTDAGIQAMRQLLHENAVQVLRQLASEKHLASDFQTTFEDRQGNQLTYEEALAKVQGLQPNSQSSEPATENGPQITFTEDTKAFGIVPEKAELVTRFIFKNTGTEPLIIEKVNTGCGCTVAKLPKNDYAPGEAGHLDITYNPKGVGAQKRSIQVLTNDADLRITTLLLTADVIPIVAARPTTVQLGTVSLGQTREVIVEIVSRDKDMKILGANVNGPEFAAEVVKGAERTSGLVEPELPGYGQVKLTMLGNADVGRLLRRLTIDAIASEGVGSPQQNRTISVSLFAQIKGHLTVEPPFIRVKPLQAGESFERETVLYHDDGKPFKIVGEPKVLNSNIDATVTVVPTEHDGKPGYKIMLSGQAGRVAARFRGKIQLTTDVERQRIVDIDFSGLVRAARAQR